MLTTVPFSILWSIGQNGRNKAPDVAAAQVLLNLASKPDIPPIQIDGKWNSSTIEALQIFQTKYLRLSRAALSIEPGSTTIRALIVAAIPKARLATQLPSGNASALSESDYQDAAKRLSCEVAAVKAVAAVESAGRGFLPSGLPKILFEAEKFGDDTHHKFDHLFPNISSRIWDQSLYKGGQHEYDRLRKGMLLDRTAALRSASWGKFQILGRNCKHAGHANLDSFIGAMFKGERAHLDAFCAFVTTIGLVDAMRKHDWKAFAAGYNGKKYFKKHYDKRIEEEFIRAKGGTHVASR